MEKAKSKRANDYDVVVIGGGPAGMFAAGTAAKKGLQTLIVEKNQTLGRKLLITGGGRCNMTNAEMDARKFLDHLGDSGKFLFSTFSQFGVQDTLDFFEKRGLKTKTEEYKRVFPIDNDASSVRDVLVSYAKENGVEVIANTKVLGFVTDKNKEKLRGVRVSTNDIENEISARNFIMACGGTSHPETGSTGDGYKWLEEIGHKVIIPELSLVPIAIKDQRVKDLQGITLPDVKFTAIQNGKKMFVKKGRVLFTHFGISGPTVINMSKDVGELLKYGPVEISLDLFPSLDYGMINTKLQELFQNNLNKHFKNCITELFPSRILPAVISISKINPNKMVNEVTREERISLTQILKDLKMSVDHLLGPERSIVTSGGVELTEVDFKTMQSRLFPNLLFAGDILNIERPSGGFSLQICWTTGFVAGNSIEKIA